VVRAAAQQLAGQAAVAQVDTQQNPRLADRFQVRGIPALVILRRGRMLDSLSGARSLPEILAWFRRVVARPD
jgi:thioredoxin 2